MPESPYNLYGKSWIRLTYAPQRLQQRINRADLFRLLREIGVLDKDNIPTEELIAGGQMHYDTVIGPGKRGRPTVYRVPLVSPTGLSLIDRLITERRQSSNAAAAAAAPTLFQNS
ncbi:MAG TPA: hypothetical protein VK658_28425 [Chryseolinea sp.]|nr:hypothetical protein [Chryseolinea sp.]